MQINNLWQTEKRCFNNIGFLPLISMSGCMKFTGSEQRETDRQKWGVSLVHWPLAQLDLISVSFHQASISLPVSVTVTVPLLLQLSSPLSLWLLYCHFFSPSHSLFARFSFHLSIQLLHRVLRVFADRDILVLDCILGLLWGLPVGQVQVLIGCWTELPQLAAFLPFLVCSSPHHAPCPVPPHTRSCFWPSTHLPFDCSVTLYIPHHLLHWLFHVSGTAELQQHGETSHSVRFSLAYLLWSCFVEMMYFLSSCPAAFNRWPLHDTSSGLTTQRRPLVYCWTFDRNDWEWQKSERTDWLDTDRL